MSALLEVYDQVWVYLAAHPIDGTSAGFVTYAKSLGYLTADINAVSALLYPELITRMVIKIATFEAVRAAFQGSTEAQRLRVVRDIRAVFINGPFKLDRLTTDLNNVNAILTTITRQLTSSVVARSTINSTFPPSQIKTDTLVIFDLGVVSLNSQKTRYMQLAESISEEIANL